MKDLITFSLISPSLPSVHLESSIQVPFTSHGHLNLVFLHNDWSSRQIFEEVMPVLLALLAIYDNMIEQMSY